MSSGLCAFCGRPCVFIDLSSVRQGMQASLCFSKFQALCNSSMSISLGSVHCELWLPQGVLLCGAGYCPWLRWAQHSELADYLLV